MFRISSHALQMREKVDQKNSEYEHFLRSVQDSIKLSLW